MQIENSNVQVTSESMPIGNTVLSDVFSFFYGSDPLRPSMHNPFEIDGFTYATDAYTLIKCKSDLIDFEWHNEENSLKVENVVPNVNTSEIIHLDSIDWASLMNKDETIGDGNDDVECGHCKGYGNVDDDLRYKGKFYSFEYECPVCDGSGFEEEEKQIPTGNKTFNSSDIIRLKNTYFYATKFYKLKKVKDLIGGEIELISYNENNKGVLFRIGIVDILIMPCICNSQDYVILNIA